MQVIIYASLTNADLLSDLQEQIPLKFELRYDFH